jgi:ribosomal protein L11 methyltransferase
MAEGRRWLELRVRAAVPGDLRGLVADAIVRAGARGVEERDGSFIAWFEEPADPSAFVEVLTGQLASEIGERGLRVEYGWQDHEEWAETWKRGLTSRRITDRVIVHPSWIEPEGVREGDIVVQIDPGMAFGTAEHGTTRGCLRLLDGLVCPGDVLLDVGSGSGILAIAAAHLGATSVVAIEADSLACEALGENVTGNGVGSVVHVVEAFATSEDLASRGPVDGIVANIESGLLEPLFDGCVRALHGSGWLLVSGILEHEWDEMERRLLDLDLQKREMDADGEWRSGLFVLPPQVPHVVDVTA